MPVHVVQQGEYLSLITLRYGLPWEKVWEDPNNQALRDLRKSPNILYPGDKVYIPDLEKRQESCPTEKKHKFRLKGSRQKLKVVLRDTAGQPITDIDYRLHVPCEDEREGKTDGQGLIEEDVPADVDQVRLIVPDLGLHFDLMVGHLDPVSRITGVQQRLNNLGFNCGPVDGIVGPLTRGALRRFQTWAGLKPTGIADATTRQELEKAHDGLSRGADPEDRSGTAPQTTEGPEEYGPSDPVETGGYDADGADNDDDNGREYA